jgi:small conductance mechanosensitive channel
MGMLQDVLTVTRAWLPFAIALGTTIVVLGIARSVLIVRRLVLGRFGTVARELVMLLLTAVAAAALVLTLPVSDTTRGQLLSLLGLVVTAAIALSSTTFIGNAMAGLMLRALHNFRAGDFLKVGDHVGRVSEQGFLHTEIQTEDRDLTTLPNLYLVTNPVTVVRSSGTIVSATVSLGYDVSRRRVEALLREAAERAELAEPFVQILELGDFAVTYRVAGFLTEVRHLITARSRLRAMMLDSLHEGGVEIVSPTFMNQRRLPEERRFVPPAEEEPTAAARADRAEDIPEALMFDKAEEAESLEQARYQVERVADEIEATKRARDGAPPERRAGFDARLAILETQRARFAERAERMAAAADAAKHG